MKHFEKLSEFCNKNNLYYDDNTDFKFKQFCDLLIETNKVMNLTAITDPLEIEIKHFIDSVEAAGIIKSAFSEVQDTDNEFNVVDIGTGAGFPGIPLSMVLPDISFTLADSLEKRINFIKQCSEICGLNNITAIHGRAEDLGKTEMREKFDICVSRAVAAMPVLLEYCLPFVKVGGKAILYKSGNYEEELDNAANALKVLGGKIEDTIEFELPGVSMKRSLIVVSKNSETPSKYPRKAGKPAKAPL